MHAEVLSSLDVICVICFSVSVELVLSFWSEKPGYVVEIVWVFHCVLLFP
jgi:hypothetical protein